MQEFYNLIMILISIPTVGCLILALMNVNFKPKRYYKHVGHRWIRKGEGMEYTNVIEEMSRRRRTACRICGELIRFGESFYTDGYTTEHMDCYFEQQKEN